MKIKAFIESVKEFLGLDNLKKKGKKKSLKNLLKILYEKEAKINIRLREKLNDKDKKELEEERDIIGLHIKKGEKIRKNFDE